MDEGGDICWLSGPTLDPESYDERRQAMWAELVRAADAGFPGGVPAPVDGHVAAACSRDCGVQVAVSPAQEELRRADPEAYRPVCYLCLLEVADLTQPEGIVFSYEQGQG